MHVWTRTITLPEKSGLEEESVIHRSVCGGDEDWQGCHLSLDLAHVGYLSSMDLAALVALHLRLKRLGGRLTLVNLEPVLYEVFEVTQLDRFFDIREADVARTP